MFAHVLKTPNGAVKAWRSRSRGLRSRGLRSRPNASDPGSSSKEEAMQRLDDALSVEVVAGQGFLDNDKMHALRLSHSQFDRDAYWDWGGKNGEAGAVEQAASREVKNGRLTETAFNKVMAAYQKNPRMTAIGVFGTAKLQISQI